MEKQEVEAVPLLYGLLCRVEALDGAVLITTTSSFGPEISVSLRLHLGLWWAAEPQRAYKGHKHQKKVQR